MTLTYRRKNFRVRDVDDLYVNENELVRIRDVATVRFETAPGRWQSYVLNGEESLLELCGIQGVPNEYTLQLDGHELSLSVGLAHFTPEQVDNMVAFLGDQEYRLNMRAAGGETSRTYTALHDDIEGFVLLWARLAATVAEIVRYPGEQLTTVLDEVDLQHRQRHNASTLVLNLRTGRLTLEGVPTAERVYALKDQVTLDTAENSQVRATVEAYEDRQAVLLDRAARQIQSLEFQLKQEISFDSPDTKLQQLKHLIDRMQQLRQALAELEPLPLPQSWRLLKHKPSTETNRARFDERYAEVIELEAQLWHNHIQKRPHNAMDLLQECGRRATWQLYEYWVFAQVFALLEGLAFDCEDPDGFQTFEDWQGASYGLIENKSVQFRHSSGLKLSLTYERHLPWVTEKDRTTLKPDIVLELHGLDHSWPLVLDAKYKNYTEKHSKLGKDFEKSARRYDRAMGGALAFLVHPGHTDETPWQFWPARGLDEDPSIALESDFPLQHGIVAVAPRGKRAGRIDALRRVLTAWLVKNGIYWVCFRCGTDLSQFPDVLSKPQSRSVAGFKVIKDIGRQNLQQMQNSAYRCPCCGLVAVISFCSNCQQHGVHSVMYKHYPHLDRGDDLRIAVATTAWVEQMEIMHPVTDKNRYYVRHCAKCGSDYIPGERRT